jgi:small subunit ribosomal protein S4
VVKSGDLIEIKAKDNFKKLLKETSEVNAKDRSIAAWLDVDSDNFTIKINRLPQKEDLTLPINEQLIVELYSK